MTPQVAHRSRPCAGETVSGDVAVSRAAGERTLLAVVDVLGHGPVAAEAAEVAAEYLQNAPLTRPLHHVVQGLGESLRGHRGAAAFLCLLTGRHIEAAGVGNVEMRVLGSAFRASPTPGILGGRVRRLRIVEGELTEPCRLVLFSDGVRGTFPDDAVQDPSPDRVCEVLLAEHGRARDDATVLVADIP